MKKPRRLPKYRESTLLMGSRWPLGLRLPGRSAGLIMALALCCPVVFAATAAPPSIVAVEAEEPRILVAADTK